MPVCDFRWFCLLFLNMRTLTVTDTNVLKGIALLLLLCHHCFVPGQTYDDIILFGHPVVQNIGEFSKLCVTIFVFLSGYGLTIQTMAKGSIGNIFAFYRRRYVKLMINYWLIWLLFVPLGILVFNRTFPIVYGEHYAWAAFWDFWGLHAAVVGSPWGYNPTWGFYSCIIMLYLVYPIIWKFRRWWMVMIPFSILFPIVAQFLPLFESSGCAIYLLAFICGMLFAYLKPEMGGANLVGRLLLFMLLLIACWVRFYMHTIMWDSAITILGVVLYCNVLMPRFIHRSLVFIGKHSYNIFLFHTFIYYYYFPEYIYWSSNPLFIYSTLLTACILISIGIEKIKNIFCINNLQNRLAGNG